MEAGFLKRLAESELWPRVGWIFGTSAGALAGVMGALDRIDELEEFLIGLRPDEVFRPNRLWRLPLIGLHEYTLPATIDRKVGISSRSRRSSRTPTASSSSSRPTSPRPSDDSENHFELAYSSRETPPATMEQAILASAAISTLVLPLRVGDRIATDGAWTRNFPLGHAYARPEVKTIVAFRYLPEYPASTSRARDAQEAVAAVRPRPPGARAHRRARGGRVPRSPRRARALHGHDHATDASLVLRGTVLEERYADAADQSIHEFERLARAVASARPRPRASEELAQAVEEACSARRSVPARACAAEDHGARGSRGRRARSAFAAAASGPKRAKRALISAATSSRTSSFDADVEHGRRAVSRAMAADPGAARRAARPRSAGGMPPSTSEPPRALPRARRPRCCDGTPELATATGTQSAVRARVARAAGGDQESSTSTKSRRRTSSLLDLGDTRRCCSSATASLHGAIPADDGRDGAPAAKRHRGFPQRQRRCVRRLRPHLNPSRAREADRVQFVQPARARLAHTSRRCGYAVPPPRVRTSRAVSGWSTISSARACEMRVSSTASTSTSSRSGSRARTSKPSGSAARSASGSRCNRSSRVRLRPGRCSRRARLVAAGRGPSRVEEARRRRMHVDRRRARRGRTGAPGQARADQCRVWSVFAPPDGPVAVCPARKCCDAARHPPRVCRGRRLLEVEVLPINDFWRFYLLAPWQARRRARDTASRPRHAASGPRRSRAARARRS